MHNREFDAFARRIVRAYARRVAAGDLDALAALRQLASTVEIATADAVQGLEILGHSWADIADHNSACPGRRRKYVGVLIRPTAVGWIPDFSMTAWASVSPPWWPSSPITIPEPRWHCSARRAGFATRPGCWIARRTRSFGRCYAGAVTKTRPHWRS